MFTIPGFDPKVFTDEQMIKKMQDLSRRIVYANRFSGSFEMIAQLQNMMGALEHERRERIYRQLYDMRDKLFPEIIETEPDMKVESDGERQKKEARQISEDRPRKSKRPQRQSPLDQGIALGPSSQPATGNDPGAR